MFQIIETHLPGCLELRPRQFKDDRGLFMTIFQSHWFADHGLCSSYTNEFLSWSKAGVLRGLHFQVPPMEQIKLVGCISGRILDVVVDVRVGSPTYGRHCAQELTSERGNLLYVPAGLAHGFCVLSQEASVLYRASQPYSPPSEGGIRWDSAGIDWPIRSPALSPKDNLLPALESFTSPFRFQAER